MFKMVFTMTNKQTLQWLLNAILFVGLIVRLPSAVYAEPSNNAITDTKVVKIVKSNFGLTNTSNTAFVISIGNGGEAFEYRGTASSPSLSTKWVNLKSSTSQRFHQPSASGSVDNKWHLTKIVIEYSTQSSTVGQTNVVKLNEITLFSFVSTTNSASDTNLTNNAQVATKEFLYEDEIKTFTIVPTLNLFIAEITMTYTIDYTNC